jgi:hypothetical protein
MQILIHSFGSVLLIILRQISAEPFILIEHHCQRLKVTIRLFKRFVFLVRKEAELLVVAVVLLRLDHLIAR